MWGCSLFCQQHKQILFTEVYVIDIIKKKNTTNSFDKDDLSFAYFFLLKVMGIVHHFKNDSYFLTLNQWPRNFSWAILKVIQRLMWCMWQIFSFCFLYVYGCHGLGAPGGAGVMSLISVYCLCSVLLPLQIIESYTTLIKLPSTALIISTAKNGHDIYRKHRAVNVPELEKLWRLFLIFVSIIVIQCAPFIFKCINCKKEISSTSAHIYEWFAFLSLTS